MGSVVFFVACVIAISGTTFPSLSGTLRLVAVAAVGAVWEAEAELEASAT